MCQVAHGTLLLHINARKKCF